jgi:hypothetical protein
MQRTISIANYYSLSNTNVGGENLVVRPPQNLKVFRATIFCDSRDNLTRQTTVYVGTSIINSNLEGIFLTNYSYFEVNTNVPPATDQGKNIVPTNSLVLDRRGIGYLCDDLYFYGKGGISILWEGIIEE